MYGGLKKSASRLALVAAAGVLSTGAYAADLGGDCCADLEERVAELEATTARKGNRKVSLTIFGQVNKTVMYWNDGGQSNTFMGLDNSNSSTRFGFRGDAKISPTWTAGYAILIDINSGATSAQASQTREDTPTGASALGGGCAAVVGATSTTGQAASCGLNAFSNDHSLRMREANWWIQSSNVGRLTMGRINASNGPTGVLDLGGVSMAASASQSLVGGSFAFRNGATGALASRSLAGVSDALADYSQRTDGIQYTSPTFAGFTFGATLGEALTVDRRALAAAIAAGNGSVTGNGSLGYIYSVNLRYATDISGVRLAASAGYERSSGEEANGSAGCAGPLAPGLGAANPGVTGACTTVRPDGVNWGFALSLMHAQTGLFAQGHWIRHERGNDDGTTDAATNWMVQGGIAQNWLGIGNTVLFGEYSRVDNGQNTFAAQNGTAITANTGGSTATAEAQVGSNYSMWGLGVVQNIDAAAMELYLGYRNHSLSDNTGTPYNDIQIVHGGARIRF